MTRDSGGVSMNDARAEKSIAVGDDGITTGLQVEPCPPGLSNPKDDSIAKILNSLRAYGYAHIKEPLSPAQFELISSRIGMVELKTDIKVDTSQEQAQRQQRITGGRPSTYQAQGLGFHSDNPRMNVLAWHCLEQDDLDGALYLIDVDDVAEHLTAEELTILTGTHVMYSSKREREDTEELLKEPLLTKISSGYRVYYQPWLLLDTYNEEQLRALESFHEYVERARRRGPIRVKLEKHEALFIDNRRMLHGRNSIAENSKRHLIRFFLRAPDLRH